MASKQRIKLTNKRMRHPIILSQGVRLGSCLDAGKIGVAQPVTIIDGDVWEKVKQNASVQKMLDDHDIFASAV